MFVDKAIVFVKGGDGGNGCSSFRREKFVPKGGPDGGDGGGGGDVIFEAVSGEQSLVDLVYNRHLTAQRGPHGRGKNMHGRKGASISVKVPIGTIIRDAVTGEELADLSEEGREIVIAKGGKGGQGNARFLSSTNRAPRECEEGHPGEEKEIELELKTIADIGFVGYPNAGKSTLLRALSHAKPKVAPYPFTTLHPIVGVIDFPDFFRIKLADIPGLIDGAHENIGLGHEFLKHIERTDLLAYVLDTAGVDGRTPWDDLLALQNELELYMKGLSKRRFIIIANKMDLPESNENFELLKESLDEHNILCELIPISAETDEDFSQLTSIFRKILETEINTNVQAWN